MESLFASAWFDGERLIPTPVRICWSGDTITAIDTCDLPAAESPLLAIPGMVNLHCHLELTSVPALPATNGFAAWVESLGRCTSAWSPQDWERSFQDGCARSLQAGVTTILDTGNSGANLEPVQLLTVLPMLEVLGSRAEQAQARFDSALRNVSDRRGGYPQLTPHSGYGVSAPLLRLLFQHLQEQGLVSVHAAESQDEEDLFRHGQGALERFLAARVPDHPFHGGQSPYGWLVAHGLLRASLLVHGNYLQGQELQQVRDAGHALVHCPSSHQCFGHRAFPWGEVRKLGIPVCIGTDSMASGSTLSLLDEAWLAWKRNPGMSAEDVLAMVTSVPARVLGRADAIGSLREGLRADIVVLEQDPVASGQWEHPPVVRTVVAGGRRIKG